MNQQNVMDEKNTRKLLVKLSLPATIGMLVMSLYNIVDSLFVGQAVGAIAIAALTIVMPLQMLLQGFGQMMGIGGASLLSRSLGEKDTVQAGRTIGNVISIALIGSILFTIISLIFLDPILKLFGASAGILPYSRQYAQIVICFAIFLTTTMTLNNLVRAEGQAKIAMFTMLISAIANIILDALFIFVFHMGIRGVAFATGISQILSFLFLVHFYVTSKSSVRLSVKDFIPSWAIFRETAGIGVASFVRQTGSTTLSIIINRTLVTLGGDMSVAIYGIMMRVVMFIFTPLMGISQGMQPVVGYNYGARRLDKMKESIKLSFIFATVLATLGAGLVYFFPETIMGIFTKETGLLTQGAEALRYCVMAFPLVGIHIVGNTIFQALGKSVPNFLLSISRQILFFLPLVLILPRYLDLKGVWLSFPIADILATLITLYMVWDLARKSMRIEENPIHQEVS